MKIDGGLECLVSLRDWVALFPIRRAHRSGDVRAVWWVLCCLIALLPAADYARADEGEPSARSRVAVLTDISNEPDDEMSLVRFLVYANEFEVEGLIATTSVWLRDKLAVENDGKPSLTAYRRVIVEVDDEK